MQVEDSFGHHISYLRISVTDRCNERCAYCMPNEFQEWLPRDGIMTYEEILRVVRIAADLGVTKIRVTGGEPLTRRDVIPFIKRLSKIEGIQDLGISTNGTLLSNRVEGYDTAAQALSKAGVRTINVSLDTLDESTYVAITGRPYLNRVIEGIDHSLDAGFERVKINSVLMRGRSEDEILELVDFSHKRNLLLRFIEMMPVSSNDVLKDSNFLPCGEVIKSLSDTFGRLQSRSDYKTNGPASYYMIPGRDQLIGFIGAMTKFHFCESCNKLRLTCDGKLRPCLGSHLEFDLLSEIRCGASDERIANFIRGVVAKKPKEHDFLSNYQPGRKMIAIGG
ncbi:MAG: GTP 3',8-cyclase MoaA [Verrucomicrobiaceae bacterium]|nr:GTP 3',8-cyclase MoaA [Verrucomicrobiaceae bacterium]